VLIDRALSLYRRTGADPPWGDSLAPHGVAMEGWFWRITDAESGRVVVVLCGCCRGAAGDWTLIGLAAAPYGIVRSAIYPPARVADGGRTIAVPGGALHAEDGTLTVELGADARLEAHFGTPSGWPRRAFGALGLGHGVPALGQYWHPHMLGASVDGRLTLGDLGWEFSGARGYGEKNWGRGFPNRWWWGQASGLGGDEDACVAFAGGDVAVGPVALEPTALVLLTGGRVLRLGAPFARVDAEVGDGVWQVRAKSPRYVLDVEGDANGSRPHTLPVPVPEERRLIDGPAQHFTGRLRVHLRRGRRIAFSGESELAALERGDLSAAG
jgi:hypothetical protein